MKRRDIAVRPAQLAVAVALLAALAGCTASTRPAKAATSPVSATRKASPGPRSPSPVPSKPAPSPSPAKTGPSVLQVAAASAGDEPQTSAFPKTTDAAFSAEVHDVWLAVTTGNPDYAKPAFFPEKAYEQVKAIADPQSDWQDRLWYDFTLDLAAVHKLVGKDPTLVKVIVPTQYARWIPPGACYNSIGYWHVPGSRVVYRSGGVTRSFGIASFISWRGDWYLVHLGALVRGGAYGIVDDPAQGEGVPGPPGGC